ncbi:MAG: HD domain-containing protein [bacterium]
MLFKAIEFAAKAHSGQYRKQTQIPYIIHPLAVAQILIETGCAPDLVVAGVLHDTVEDTLVTLAEIEETFGENVARLVAGATEPEKSHAWEMRKQHTLESLKSAPEDIVVLVCADKLHNLRSIRQDVQKYGDSVWDRFSRSRQKQKWYFEALALVFAQRLEGKAGRTLLREFEEEVRKVFGAEDGDVKRQT